MSTRATLFLALPLLVFASACRSAYYGAMEAMGVHKREILVSRVEEGREQQEDAKEQFQSTYEAFQALTGQGGGELEARYKALKKEYDECAKDAGRVADRVRQIETQALGQLRGVMAEPEPASESVPVPVSAPASA